MSLARTVHDETLDALAPDDPRARRSRRDLVRVHLAMGTRGILARALLEPPTPRPGGDGTLEVLELGAGDGTLMLAVARRIASRWPPVRLTLLDRVDIVDADVRAGYAALGWELRVLTADVLDWAAAGPATRTVDAASTRTAAAGDRAPHRPDLVVTSLFLHHFERPALRALLGAVAARTDRFVAYEPRRDGLALAGSRLVALLGANDVTREDAVLSVRAGFRDAEIADAWPGPDRGWDVRERRAGPFGHLVDARRRRPT